MTRSLLWSLSVTTAPEAEEAVTEWLATTFGEQPTSYTEFERGQTVVTVFLKKRPAWSPARQLALKNYLRELKHFGLNTGSVRITLARLPRRNWAESWKHHFHPITIRSGRCSRSRLRYGERTKRESSSNRLGLLIKPTWSQRTAARNQATVVLNPGLSFGTGKHPTTRFCLEQIVSWRRPGVAQSFLDVGTGSGILAIAAAKLGYSPVEALDSDPEAIRFARANLGLNRLSSQVQLSQKDVSRLPRHSRQRYSVVCANLIADLLIEESERIVARVETNGLLIVAGILVSEFAQVRQVYSKWGLRLLTGCTNGEWRSAGFFFR